LLVDEVEDNFIGDDFKLVVDTNDLVLIELWRFEVVSRNNVDSDTKLDVSADIVVLENNFVGDDFWIAVDDFEAIFLLVDCKITVDECGIDVISLDIRFVDCSVPAKVLDIMFVEKVEVILPVDDFWIGVDNVDPIVLLDKDILEIWVFDDVVSRYKVDSDVMMLDIKVVGSVDIILLEILVLDKVENNLVGDCFWFGVDDSDPIVLLVYCMLEVVKITVDEYVIDVIANVEVSVAILLLEVDEVENNFVGDCFWFIVVDSDPIVPLVSCMLELVKITVDVYGIDVIVIIDVSVAILLLEVEEVEIIFVVDWRIVGDDSNPTVLLFNIIVGTSYVKPEGEDNIS